MSAEIIVKATKYQEVKTCSLSALVAMMMEGAGLEVIDLGVDITVEKVIDKVHEIQPRVLGLSALPLKLNGDCVN